MNTITKLAKGPILPLALIVASCATWVVMPGGADPVASSPASPNAVFFVQPLEENASETVPDWASGADLVVKAVVTAERAIEPRESETSEEDGFDLVGRTVSLKVSDVIWRSPNATEPNPTTVTMDAFGWMRSDDGSEREVAVEGASRLEPGHQYVIALQWRDTEQAPGDPTVPAHWSVLGSGAVLPADGGTIGVGEFEGGTLELAELETDAPVSPDAVLAEFAGEKPSTMEAALDEAARE